jgi:FkbM family methyltransferase
MYNYPFLWKKLHKFTHRSALGKLIARFSKLAEHASRGFPGNDGFEITGELGLLKVLSGNWNANSVVFDVGANRGDWTALALSLGGENLQIRAFEPDSRLTSLLSSRFSGKSVTVENLGLGATSDELDLYVEPLGKDAGNSFTNPSEGTREFTATKAPVPATQSASVVTGDSYISLAGIESIQLLKIDTEGYEMEVLRGFEESLRRGCIEVIQFEYNFAAARAKLNLLHFMDFLEPLGYRVGKLSYSGIDLDYKLEWNNYDSAPNYIAVRKDLMSSIIGTFSSVGKA